MQFNPFNPGLGQGFKYELGPKLNAFIKSTK
jgi:hypothetical protein